jgi:hypothetical protein
VEVVLDKVRRNAFILVVIHAELTDSHSRAILNFAFKIAASRGECSLVVDKLERNPS